MLSEQQKIAHLLRRFGFGASEAELAYYGQGGLPGAIDKLLDYESVEEGFSVDPNSLANAKNNKLKIEAVQEWWLMRMITSRRPLQEKMTLFWHNHFATSSDKVTSPYMMLTQNQIFRSGATGKFQDLLMNVSKDPAMLLWLDNQYNVKGHPNENFAREVMELFTLGIGHYTEHDIQESARAFTGWGFGVAGGAKRKRKQTTQKKPARNQVFLDNAAKHDEGVKEFLGNKGNFDGDDILGILCSNPQCARFITSKLWSWFAYPNPEDSLVQRLAEPFYRDGLDIKKLLRAIMESPEFYSDRAYRSLYKNPVDFAVTAVRQLGFGEQALTDDNFRSDVKPATALRIATKGMGMNLFWPPDVSGWKGGSEWVSTGTIVERIRLAQVLFEQAEVAVKNRKFTMGTQAYNLFAQDPSPEGVARRLVSILDANLPAAKLTELTRAAHESSGGRVTPENANATASAVTRLIFASPEFQFC
ncbi:MAG TPA: DUF1800 domain-containing protein [Fimbriimonadaceae bacterium]|nr:DUF1800 domain-containing protein [Fimbriimonadaceae bacterium]